MNCGCLGEFRRPDYLLSAFEFFIDLILRLLNYTPADGQAKLAILIFGSS